MLLKDPMLLHFALFICSRRGLSFSLKYYTKFCGKMLKWWIFSNFLKKFLKIFKNFHKNFLQIVFFVQTRKHLTNGLLNFVGNMLKWWTFRNFLKKIYLKIFCFFENFVPIFRIFFENFLRIFLQECSPPKINPGYAHG